MTALHGSKDTRRQTTNSPLALAQPTLLCCTVYCCTYVCICGANAPNSRLVYTYSQRRRSSSTAAVPVSTATTATGMEHKPSLKLEARGSAIDIIHSHAREATCTAPGQAASNYPRLIMHRISFNKGSSNHQKRV